MGTFSADIGRFVNNVPQRADQVMRKIAIDLTEEVRARTPVDTGQLRASWTSSIDAPPTSYNGADTSQSVKFGQTWYLATDKPYAPKLEYGLYPQPGGAKTQNGFSIQAPQGMVRISVKRTQEWLEKVRF